MSFFNNLSNLFNKEEARKQAAAGGGAPAPTDKSAKTSQSDKPESNNKPNKRRRHKKRGNKRSEGGIPAAKIDQHQLVRQAKSKAQEIELDAQGKAREIVVEAKSEALQIRSKAEKESRDLSKELDEKQRAIDTKLDRIDAKLTNLEKKDEELDKEKQELIAEKQRIDKSRQEAISRLEEVSSMTREEAKQALFDDLGKRLSKEMALFIRQKEEEARIEAEEKSKTILIDVMKHGATDYVPEYTVSTVTLPSEDTKGKIIGKQGRNINAFEKATGVDVDLDMGPTEVRLSCFDPVRREIARISLERLVKDGRIQPTRIEEVVAKVTSELDKIMLESGKKLCHEVGVYNLPVELMRLLGKFRYRFSYGQNLITHTLEETKIGIKLAHELKVDVNTVKLGCLLHDIGKVSEETDGSHVELGIKIARRYGMSQAVIDCIAQHHEDEPFSGPEQMVVYIVDAMSGARPGARYENYDEYVKRLSQLEEIATQYNQVKQAYAIQAGREVRVLLEPEKSHDDDVTVLSTKIRDEIKEKMTYPGTVTVTVVREVRGQKVAS